MKSRAWQAERISVTSLRVLGRKVAQAQQKRSSVLESVRLSILPTEGRRSLHGQQVVRMWVEIESKGVNDRSPNIGYTVEKQGERALWT